MGRFKWGGLVWGGGGRLKWVTVSDRFRLPFLTVLNRRLEVPPPSHVLCSLGKQWQRVIHSVLAGQISVKVTFLFQGRDPIHCKANVNDNVNDRSLGAFQRLFCLLSLEIILPERIWGLFLMAKKGIHRMSTQWSAAGCNCTGTPFNDHPPLRCWKLLVVVNGAECDVGTMACGSNAAVAPKVGNRVPRHPNPF